MNVVVSMESPCISWAAIAIVLSATSCIEQESAERPPDPKTVPEAPAIARAAPDRSPVEDTSSIRAKDVAPADIRRERPSEASAPPPAAVESADTWEQMRLLMAMVPVRPEVSSLREFRRKLRRYHGNQPFFDAIGERARPWLYHITRQLAAREMPGEIALLPAVESSYDAAAVSSRDAAGLWQILPGTARDLKLARSWWYDGRHDVLAGTSAALDYLASLHGVFNDDWMLAVAAYNCGPGNVRRAIRRAGLRIETADYTAIEHHLPRETRSHIARWLVISEIVAMPRLHNVRLKAIAWRPYFSEVSAQSQIDLAAAAKHAGIPLPEFLLLNLGLTRGMTAPNGPHRLLVPAEHAGRFSRELPRMRPSIHAERRRYRIREGDSLSLIALAHNTTVKTLMAANRLDSHLIRAGRELLIPMLRDRSAEPAPTETDMHIVTPGDSLWLIARQYQTTVSLLRDWNHLAPGANLIHPGQMLRVRDEG